MKLLLKIHMSQREGPISKLLRFRTPQQGVFSTLLNFPTKISPNFGWVCLGRTDLSYLPLVSQKRFQLLKFSKFSPTPKMLRENSLRLSEQEK